MISRSVLTTPQFGPFVWPFCRSPIYYPTKGWLTANVSPIYKWSQCVDAKNFQPVSLTSTCSKVMERISKGTLTWFADSKKVMSMRQHGFRHNRSCLTNPLNSLEQWTRTLEKKSEVDVMYFDFWDTFSFLNKANINLPQL